MQPSPSTAACSPDCFRAVYPEAPLLGPPRTAVAAAAVAGAAFPDLAADGELTAPLAYEGTTEQGT